MLLPANKFKRTRWSFLNDWLVRGHEGFAKRRRLLLFGFSFLLLTTLGAVLSIPVRNHLARKKREARLRDETAQLIDYKEENGARGGSRTHMRKNPRRILSPQRLPFRHPGQRAEMSKVSMGEAGAGMLSA